MEQTFHLKLSQLSKTLEMVLYCQTLLIGKVCSLVKPTADTMAWQSDF